MKKTLLFGGIGTVVLAGGISAYSIYDKTPKEAYFYAEYKTADAAMEFITDRYAPELTWYETQLEKPTQNDFKLSANVNDNTGSLGWGIAEAISSVSIDVTTQIDPKNSHNAFSIGATIFDKEIDQFGLFITDKKIIAEVPFQDEALEVDLAEVFELIEMTTGENTCMQDVDVQQYIKSGSVVSEKDQKYLIDTYVKGLYDTIPEDAFTQVDEKITMELSGKEIQTILISLATSAEKDKKLLKILDDIIHSSDPCSSTESKETLELVVNELTAAKFDFDIKSTIWVEKNKVVKRELEIDNALFKGTQKFGKELEFDLDAIDRDNNETIYTIKGSLGSGDSFKDEIEVKANGNVVFEYKSEEDLKNSTRQFERSISFSEGIDIRFDWTGELQYEADNVSGEQKFALASNELGNISLVIENDGKTIKDITVPKKTVNLSKMSEDELDEYFEFEVAPKFYDWSSGLFSGLGDLF